MSKWLIAYECSGRVRDAFIALGHDAWSCDIKPTEAPEPHYQCDVAEVVGLGWDCLIAHPECRYVCASGLHWNRRRPGREAETEKALETFRWLAGLPIPKKAIENPHGCISTRVMKPTQVIQPWQFGEDASKATCLWLWNLPPLMATKIILPRWACACGCRFDFALGAYGCPSCRGEGGKARAVWANQTAGGQNRLGPSPTRSADRARTYHGIALAMAEQWGGRA